ncbi:MAG TPA: Uma2 family endonuclease [Pseudonocardiaceae bacterium]|jgi:Uma2 family endonuclease
MAMPADTFPQHPDNWTVEEVLALPEDQGSRYELVDGIVVVSPAPTSKHQRLLQRMQLAWVGAMPADCELLPGVNVVLNSMRLLIPDLVVVTEPGVDTVYYKGTELLMAVEIHSPSTRAFDRALKRQLYADAQIPFLVFVDPATEPASAVCYELDDGEYRESAQSDDGRLVLSRPFPLTVDLGGSGR